MTTTNMHEAASAHKWRQSASRATPKDFIAPTPEDLPSPRDCLWEHFKISPEALDVGEYLSEIAEPMNGEAIERMAVLTADLELTPIRIMTALLELQEAGIITFTIGQPEMDNGLVFAFFDVDTDIYYGDDTNPPVDNIEALEGDYYDSVADSYGPDDVAEEDNEVPINDPNPKRHRIFLKTGYRCFYCITAWVEHVDHMHPRVRGGSNDDDNLIGACKSCNSRKHDRTVEEFRAWLAHKRRLPDISHVRFWGEAAN